MGWTISELSGGGRVAIRYYELRSPLFRAFGSV